MPNAHAQRWARNSDTDPKALYLNRLLDHNLSRSYLAPIRWSVMLDGSNHQTQHNGDCNTDSNIDTRNLRHSDGGQFAKRKEQNAD